MVILVLSGHFAFARCVRKLERARTNLLYDTLSVYNEHRSKASAFLFDQNPIVLCDLMAGIAE
jgi:hypothetical protein